MSFGFPLEENVRKRYSARTYDGRAVEKDVKEKILAYAGELKNPLGPPVKFKLIERGTSANGEKLGTYGVIKGAGLYLGATVPDEETAPEALGYDYEQLVLYITSLGLGTCWLGGTFNKSAFAQAMQVKEGELFPIVSPVGYAAEKMRTFEKLMRRSVKAGARLPWSELFFDGGFTRPLAEGAAGEYACALELVRLAPSAVNRQPWRVVRADGAFHFFEKRAPGAREAGAVDMHRIDVGIAACHFHLAAIEKGLPGRFERLPASPVPLPGGTDYITSWITGGA